MSKVEKALGRLEGVSYVSAGFRSDTAILALDGGQKLDLAKVNEALKATSFSCISLHESARE